MLATCLELLRGSGEALVLIAPEFLDVPAAQAGACRHKATSTATRKYCYVVGSAGRAGAPVGNLGLFSFAITHFVGKLG
jgi:hypothetical protein